MAGLIWLWQASGGTDHSVTAQEYRIELRGEVVSSYVTPE